jgi:hypothetical protein
MENENKKQIVQDEEEQEGRIFRWMSSIVVFLAIAGFISLAWYAYKNNEVVNEKDVELIKADKTPVKEAPANPGGMDIPNQDKTVYGLIGNKDKADKPIVERILPAPEEPNIRNIDTETWMSTKAKNIINTNEEESKTVDTSAKEEAITGKKIEQFNPSRLRLVNEAKDMPAVSATAQNDDIPKPTNIKKSVVEPTTAKVEPVAAPVSKPEEPVIVKAKPPEQPPTPAILEHTPPTPIKAAALPTKGVRVQLGAYKTDAEANKDWVKISKIFADELQGKEHFIVKIQIPNKGIFYRLQLAPFASPKEAEQFCLGLVSEGQGCFTAKAK